MRILINILLKDDVCEKLNFDKINQGFKKVCMHLPFGIFFAFFRTDHNIYILNNVIYFVPWPTG